MIEVEIANYFKSGTIDHYVLAEDLTYILTSLVCFGFVILYFVSCFAWNYEILLPITTASLKGRYDAAIRMSLNSEDNER